jgi:lysophospholipase L1-like esterase
MTTRRKVIIATVLLIVLLAIGLMYIFAILLPQKQKEAQFSEAAKEYYDKKIAMYEIENENYEDYEVDVAFLGDSLTDGYDLKKYYPQYLALNRGIGGDTTFGLEKRLKISVYDLKPKVAVILIGANNFDTMFDNYENILKGLKENLPETKIVLLSLTSMSGNWGKNNQKAAYNNVKIKLLAEKYGYAFVDLYTPLFNLETGEIYAEYTTDGGHLTPAGYEVFTNAVTPVLKRLLGK